MINKRLSTLAIIVGVLAAWIISGCTISPAPITTLIEPVVTSTDSSNVKLLYPTFPQMYTPYMLENMDAIAKKHNITWLGCYDDGLGSFILWFHNNETGDCNASIAIPPDIHEETCGDAWDLYVEVCERLGNCQQLI